MPLETQLTLSAMVREAAHPLTASATDYDPLMALIGNKPFVLIGEASHGTHEFYRERAQITKRLITEKGFNAVAVEADWPDAYTINRYVKGDPAIVTAIDSLAGFDRFPAWMWRNADVLDFIGWLRAHNDAQTNPAEKAGFYGLDLYSLFTSIKAVLSYLDRVDPDAARRARYRYSCFDHYGEDTQSYGYEASFNLSKSCEDEVINQLTELHRSAPAYANLDGRMAADEFFFAEQNARLVKNAEEYYRSMFRGQVASWNLRDRHMADTFDKLVAHLNKQGTPAKTVVWAHNSHLGDARATEMSSRGEINVGQLIRERYGYDVCSIGFSTYTGTVTAATNWDGPAETKSVRPALSDSYESLCHEAGMGGFLLNPRATGDLADALRLPKLQRAIGVIYRPETERLSHYYFAQLADQFDAIIHFDKTRAVEPLERFAEEEESEEPPETYPFGQ
ncbi:MAG TPA: erythromycin esterase family protein [Blastocatellia bacterium]|nr:erythromycin esterase family protein [Blastocatellia bacterium]